MALAAMSAAVESAGPMYILRVCGEVEYGTELARLVRSSATYASVVASVDHDGPIELLALRGVPPRDIALHILAPVYAEAAGALTEDIRTDEFAAYAQRRMVLSRARTRLHAAAETLIDCLSAEASTRYFDDEFGAGARFKRMADAYAGDELTRCVFAACRTMDGIKGLIHSGATGFAPLDEELGVMEAAERVVAPVLAAMLGVDHAMVMRSLFTRMAQATPTPLGPWCSEWAKYLSESDVVALAPRLVEIGLTAAMRNVDDAATLVAEGLARNEATRARMVPADVARVSRRLSHRAVGLLADTPRHAVTIIAAFADDPHVVRRACRAARDLPGLVRTLRRVRNHRAVAAVTSAISRIVEETPDDELVSALDTCGAGAVAAIRIMSDEAFERTLGAVQRRRPRAMCAFVLERIGQCGRGTRLFDACFGKA
jgi:hypothetical protein